MLRGTPRTKMFIVGLLLVVFLFLPRIIAFYTDWLWFNDLSFEPVFIAVMNGQIGAFLAGGVLAFLIVHINLWIAGRFAVGRDVVWEAMELQIPQLAILRVIHRIRKVLPLAFGFLGGFIFYQNWLSILLYLRAVPFGFVDPVLGKDVSFYFFTIPLIELICSNLYLIIGASVVLCALTYLVRGAILFDLNRRSFTAEGFVRSHLTVLLAILFLVTAAMSYADLHAVMYSSHGIVAGATYTDIHGSMPAQWLKIIIAVVAAVLLIINLFAHRRFVIPGLVVLYLAVHIAGTVLYPTILHKFVVAPNELVKETPYITHNIAATRKAYAIDAVTERDISGRTTLTRDDVRRNGPTIENIRLWDHQPLLDTFSQVQEIRTYYQFVSVDNDRYLIDGKYRQTMLSPRELAADSIPTRNWINERLTFTHGHGVTLGLVNQVTQEGLPLLMIKDIPPVSALKDITITRPEIYFGELSSDYVIVNTKSKEFDYPSGEENVYASYGGDRGVKIDSLAKRIAFSIRFASLKLFLSNDITGDSRMLYHRMIRERVTKVAPFLALDEDPYMVITKEGRLVWIYDCYTVSRRFPYSQPYRRGINYIRNSVKATIDAYDGTTRFYIADGKDPIAATLNMVFPGLFRPLSEMPPDLRQHLRYPHDIFNIQAEIYSTYHMESPQALYNREDQWEIPLMGGKKKESRMEPYYTVMRLPGEKAEEFILMLPFNPKKKSNLSAWMVARSDGENYGKLVVYRFPKDRLVYGPAQIVARINQDTEISRQISLWDQRGSQVMQGTLLVIPIENSLIYIQPLYLKAETGKIPELKRVIVAYENQIAMEETLEAAVAKIFGDMGARRTERQEEPGARSAAAPAGQDLKPLLKKHFDDAVRAQREGNWARYGEELKKLGEVIEKMSK